jgi:ATP-binding protein involved in chromosome partitioning
MSELNQQSITAALGELRDPESGRALDKCGMIKGISIADEAVTVQIGLTTHSSPLRSEFINQTRAVLSKHFPEIKDFDVQIVHHEKRPQQLGQVGLTIKSVIAVGSGKGGVGKSTLATMLALGLHRSGCSVGLLDADVYGPSVPHLLGITEKPEQVDKKIQPIDYAGMKVLSIGLLVPPEQAVIWRGPMLHSAMTTFLRDTAWGELDYLIIDMPPGTGDIALSLSQMLPLTGTIVVCTPQQVALIDAVKAVGMYRKVNIPILGVVENMSGFVCPDNGKRYDIFGKGGAREFAEKESIPFLGEIPITMPLRELGDIGRLKDCYQDELTAELFDEVVVNLARNMAEKAAKEKPLPQLPML